MIEIYCRNCGKKLSNDNEVCPNCGSKKRNIIVTLKDKIELHDQIKGKVKRQGFKKPIREFKVGDDLHHKSGKWYHKEMYIDREKDQYKEIVKDKTTGNIIHKCEEPLSKHKGHGSAKYKKIKSNE
ncbi:MAG: zinc ribbon domain-containing protein [Thermoplasmata archaeon]|nr:zinc ribbon domain-containing protein [Thermoplasmata archaeon]